MNAAPARSIHLRRDLIEVAQDLMPASDALCVVAATLGAGALTMLMLEPALAPLTLLERAAPLALCGAVLAPLMLSDRTFLAATRHAALLPICYALRLAALLAVIGAIALAGNAWAALPQTWPVLWLSALVLCTASVRLMLLRGEALLERKGLIAESVAVLGAGSAADRLIEALQAAPGARGHVELVGLFDDRAGRKEGVRHQPDGTVADLIEIGKRRELDWIVLALPEAANGRVQVLRHRLMSLATPIALCPHDPRLVADALERGPLARAALRLALPRWLYGLVRGAGIALRRGARRLFPRRSAPRAPFRLALDPYDLEGFQAIARRFGQDRYGYVVTANVDHVIRLHRWPALRKLYAEAAYALFDSRFLAHLLRLARGLAWPVCAGSDLTARLLQDAGARDRIVLIGGSEAQAKRLAARYGLRRLMHYNPPMGFIRDPDAIEATLRFIERASPFRYCLLAVGSPQQEFVAYCLKRRGAARGLALCIGASVDFLTGAERRAPRVWQVLGCEWLFRLLQSPRRMAYRYLVRGPRIFALLRHTEIVSRDAAIRAPLIEIPEFAMEPALALQIAMPGIPARAVLRESMQPQSERRDAA